MSHNLTTIVEFAALIDNAFAKFDIPEVVRKKTFGDLNVMELWHGPTLAFKDLAMSCVGEFINYFLSKKKKHVIVLVGKYIMSHYLDTIRLIV